MPTDTCFLCGIQDKDVQLTLVRFKEEEGGKFDTLPRCRDRQACHRRVEAIGQRWEVDDPYFLAGTSRGVKP